MTRILRSRWVWAAVVLLLLGTVVAASLFPKVRSGLVIVRLKTTGSLPDIGRMDLFRMIRSGSHFNLPELVKTPNPYAAIRNPYNSPEDLLAASDPGDTTDVRPDFGLGRHLL
jgi:hypothetical protein